MCNYVRAGGIVLHNVHEFIIYSRPLSTFAASVSIISLLAYSNYVVVQQVLRIAIIVIKRSYIYHNLISIFAFADYFAKRPVYILLMVTKKWSHILQHLEPWIDEAAYGKLINQVHVIEVAAVQFGYLVDYQALKPLLQVAQSLVIRTEIHNCGEDFCNGTTVGLKFFYYSPYQLQDSMDFLQINIVIFLQTKFR